MVKDINFFDAADLRAFIAESRGRPPVPGRYGNYFDFYDGTNLETFERAVRIRRADRRAILWRAAASSVRRAAFGDLLHVAKCAILPRHLNQLAVDRYARWLFRNEPEKLSGDFSTNNFQLSRRAVELLARNSPRAKIVIGVRNPIERRWSYLRMDHFVARRKAEPFVVDRATLELLDPDGDYKSAITIWTQFFPRDQIHFAFFDQLRADPVEYLKGIYEFLDLSFEPAMVDPAARNPGIVADIPDWAREILQDKFAGQFAFLAEYFRDNAHVQQWSL